MLLPVEHAQAIQLWTAVVDQPDRIATGMGVDAMKSMRCSHLFSALDSGHQALHDGDHTIRSLLGTVILPARNQASHLGVGGNRI